MCCHVLYQCPAHWQTLHPSSPVSVHFRFYDPHPVSAELPCYPHPFSQMCPSHPSSCCCCLCCHGNLHMHASFCIWMSWMIDSLAVAAPAQQRSQVISRSEHPRPRSPGCTFLLKKVNDAPFFLKTVNDLFSRRPQKTVRQRRWGCFTVKIKQIKRSAVRYGKIFIFCSHYYRSKAKQ